MDVTEIVVSKRGLEAADQTVELAVAEAEQLIKNYCALPAVPGELVYTWVELACAFLEDLPQLSHISLGDSSYTFRAEAALSADHRAALNRFRRGLFADA